MDIVNNILAGNILILYFDSSLKKLRICVSIIFQSRLQLHSDDSD